MDNRNKKLTTQKIFAALSSTSTTGKTKQVAIDLSPNGRKKLIIEAALEDITPTEKARQALGLSIKTKKASPKLTLRLTEEDFKFLAKKYNVDPEDKLTIRNKVAEEIVAKYPEDNFEIIPNYLWPDA
ncbi:MAG: hypothetical protein OQK04_18905 [Kangiellaceae bacterium]|nr:hypothetical protein [Kangiellaceae bacterium]MCW9000788.1 hypothetical protein [Kangiellaceae bacterium]